MSQKKRKVQQLQKGTPKAIKRLRLMLARELATLAKDPKIVNRNPEEVMMSIKFTDGHVHHILPDEAEVDLMVLDLLTTTDFDLDKLNIIPIGISPEEEEELERDEVESQDKVEPEKDELEEPEGEKSPGVETAEEDATAKTLGELGLDK
jgi:hypothetical protein